MTTKSTNAAPEYDVIVAGAGPTGALVAQKLAANGWSVVMLEAGTRSVGHNALENTEANAGRIMWSEPRNHVGGDFVVPKTGVGADWPIGYDDFRPHYDEIDRRRNPHVQPSAPGGELRDVFFVQPTVFTNVDNSMRIAQEEIFGPVVCAIVGCAAGSIVLRRAQHEAIYFTPSSQ